MSLVPNNGIHVVIDIDGVVYDPHAHPKGPYADAAPALARMKELKISFSFLTHGSRNFQHAKLRQCGVDCQKTDVLVVPDFRDKRLDLKFLLTCLELESSPKRLIVVGDRPDIEIAFGGELGCTTIRIVRGKHGALDDHTEHKPHYRLDDLRALPFILEEIRKELCPV